MDFENELIYGIHATRFIASWINMGGMLYTEKDLDDFRSWLLSIGLNGSDINTITFLATTGKCELEINAKAFLKNITDRI